MNGHNAKFVEKHLGKFTVILAIGYDRKWTERQIDQLRKGYLSTAEETRKVSLEAKTVRHSKLALCVEMVGGRILNGENAEHACW